jgi:UDP-galactopyranose mutase
LYNKPILVVGAGFFGLTIARHIVENYGRDVVVVESRDHIGGNAWSEKDPETGIEVHKYGSHIFHTQHKWIWEYVNRFSDFNKYRHTVFSKIEDKFVSMPVNLLTISQIFGQALSPSQAMARIEAESSQHSGDSSFEDMAISKVGRTLYEALFRNYTLKQWQTDPKDLPGEVFSRLPIRFTFENRYFTDEFEGIPTEGYGSLFHRMTEHSKIHVVLNADYFALSKAEKEKYELTVFTGPVDRYFGYSEGRLGWRTLDFVQETLNVPDFQGLAQMNYPELQHDFTRIHEYRHFTPDFTPHVPKTVIAREYSRFAGDGDLPYYPINSSKDREILARYRDLMARENRVFFGGRLGSYKYLDMHMAIGSAVTMFTNKLRPILDK